MKWSWIIFIFVGLFFGTYLIITYFHAKVKVRRRLREPQSKRILKSQGYNFFKLLTLPLSETILRKTPENLKRKVQATIIMSGINWELSEVLLLKTLLSIIGAICGFAFAKLTGKGNLALLYIIIISLAGFIIPNFILSRKAKKRQKSIYQMLPSFVDYLIIAIEAGLGLDLAITKVISKLHGPLAEALANALTEMKYGKSRTEALKNMASQMDIPELTSLVNALTSGEKFGIGIGNILRTQALQLREKRKQRIQEEAYKIPVKLVFPLVLFILPGLFIVLLGPAAIQVVQSLF